MSETTSIEQTELATKPDKLAPKKQAEKILNDWRAESSEDKTRVAKFLATQSNRPGTDTTAILAEVLNSIKDLSLENKKTLINESCESIAEWKGYTAGKKPKEKREHTNPEKYYALLDEEKKKLAGKIQKQFASQVAQSIAGKK